MSWDESSEGLGSASILIVEDDLPMAAMLADFFADMGCRVVGPASTVASALSMLETSEVDVALLDVSVAGETSYAIAEALARTGVPVVFATGHQVLPGYQSGGAIFLPKPYRAADAVTAVRRAMEARVRVPG